jgi:hypothetical protein
MIFSENNITAITVALITGILSPLCLQIFNYYSNKRKENKKHTLDDRYSTENEESILSKLESIKEKYNCDRVWIAEFHNGTKTYSGKSFQKFSTTYEVVNQGVATEAITTQNIPISLFTPFFNKLKNDYYYYVPDTSITDEILSLTMKSFCSTRGISSFIAISIKDIRNNFVGFICLDGVINDLKIDTSDIQKLIVYASNIAGYLETTP